MHLCWFHCSVWLIGNAIKDCDDTANAQHANQRPLQLVTNFVVPKGGKAKTYRTGVGQIALGSNLILEETSQALLSCRVAEPQRVIQTHNSNSLPMFCYKCRPFFRLCVDLMLPFLLLA
jgi:hypothetical protein